MEEVHVVLEGVLELFLLHLLLFKQTLHLLRHVLPVLVHQRADLLVQGLVLQPQELQTRLEVSHYR